MLSELELKYPALSDKIRKATESGVSETDIERFISGKVNEMRLTGMGAREIGNKLGMTYDSQERYIAYKDAKKKDAIYRITGTSPQKAGDAAYIAERLGVDPGLVIQNYEAFSKYFDSMRDVAQERDRIMGFGNVFDKLENPRPTKPLPDKGKYDLFDGILPDWGERAITDVAVGALSITSSLGSFVNRLFDNSTFQKHLDDMEDFAILYSPEDPNYIDHALSAFGNMSVFVLVGSLVHAGAGLLTGASPLLANYLGAGTMAVTEASVEAEEAYKRAYDLTGDKQYAQKSAIVAFGLNLPVSFVSDKIGFFTDGSGALAGGLRAVATQAPEESVQSIINDVAVFGDTRGINWKQALYEGTVAAPASMLFGSASGIQVQADNTVSEKATEVLEWAKTEREAIGATEEQVIDNTINEQLGEEQKETVEAVEEGEIEIQKELEFQDKNLQELLDIRLEMAGESLVGDQVSASAGRSEGVVTSSEQKEKLAKRISESIPSMVKQSFRNILEESGINRNQTMNVIRQYVENPQGVSEPVRRFLNQQVFGEDVVSDERVVTQDEDLNLVQREWRRKNILEKADKLAKKLLREIPSMQTEGLKQSLKRAGIPQSKIQEAVVQYITDPDNAPEPVREFFDLQMFATPKGPKWLEKPVGEMVAEYEALKQGMRKAQKASKEGFNEGKRQQREGPQKAQVERLRESAERRVDEEKQKRKALKAAEKQKRQLEAVKKRILRIKKRAEGTGESATIRADFARAILDITETIDFKAHTKMEEQHIAEFRAELLDELSKNPDIARHIKPKELAQILKRPVKDMTLKELMEIKETVAELAAQGAALEKQRVEKIRMKRQAIIDDTIERNIWTPKRIVNIVDERLKDLQMKRADLAKKLGVSTRNLNSTLKGKNRPSDEFISRLSEAVQLDKREIMFGEDEKGTNFIMSALKGYDAWFTRFNRLGTIIGRSKDSEIHKLLNDKVNDAVNNNLRKMDERHLKQAEILKETGLNPKDLNKKAEIVDPRTKKRIKLTLSERIGIYIYNKNPESQDAIRYGNGISQEGQQVVIETLTETEKRLGDLAMQEVGENWERLAKAYLENTGLRLERVPSYFRMFRMLTEEFDIMAALNEEMDFRSNLKRSRGKRGVVTERQVIRPDSQKKIDIDFFGVWSRTINEQEQYINFYGLGQEIQNVFGDPDLLQVLRNRFGDNIVKQLEQYAKAIVNPMFYYRGEGLAKGLRVMRNHYALAVLGGNLLSMARQPFSFINYLPYTNPSGIAKALERMIANPVGAQKFISEMSPQVKHRVMSIEQREIKRYKEIWKSKGQRVLNATVGQTTILQRMADVATVRLGWLMAYESEVYRGATPEDAARFADDVTDRTQPQSQSKSLNRWLTQSGASGEIMRMIGAFNNQLMQNYNIIFHDAPAEVKAGHYVRASGLVASIVLQSLAMGWLAYKAFPDWEDTEAVVAYLSEVLRVLLPLVGGYIIDGYMGYGFSSVSQLENIFKEVGGVARDVVAGEPEKAAKHAGKVGSYSLGLPLVGSRNIMEYMETGDIANLFGGRKGDRENSKKPQAHGM